MACGHGAMLRRLLQLTRTFTQINFYALDILCCAAPNHIPARWQHAQLSFCSDNLPEILRGPPIPWRWSIVDRCSVDQVFLVNSPYFIPPFTRQPGLGKAEAYCYCDAGAVTPCGMSVPRGGVTYERTIQLLPRRDRGDLRSWGLDLRIWSQDGDWLTKLSRADAAALVGINSVIK